MQADNTEAGIKDLTQKLSSLDPITAHSAINQYFDTRAVLTTKTLRIAGADRIKKQLDLYNRAFKASEIVGEPRYNEQEQVIEFVVARLLESPKLPGLLLSLPLVNKVSEARKYIHFDGTLHLNADGVGEDGKGSAKLMVTKFEVDRREQAPLENLVPYYLFKPLLSPLANIIATVAGIVLASPWTPKGLFSMVGALINSFLLWSYSKVVKSQEQLFPQSVTWANGPDADLPSLVERNVRSGLQVVEDQAKKLGLPIDQYKEKAISVSRDVIDKTHQTLERINNQAEQAGQQVKEGVQEGVSKAQEGVQRVQEEAQKATDTDPGHSQSGTTDSSSNENAAPVERSAYKEDLPQTPFGGTDPLALGAPSFAKATEEGDLTPTQHGYKGLDATVVQPRDDLPQTPLGGTDPLAAGAPSYAKAADDANSDSNQHGYKGVDATATQPEQSRDDLPQTPLGGTDPLAKGAPSYAQAAEDDHDTTHGYKGPPAGTESHADEQSAESLPHTPLGGHDPLATGAFSYAAAAAE